MYHRDLAKKIVLKAQDTLCIRYHDDDHAPLDVVHDVLKDPVKIRLVGRCQAFRVPLQKELKIQESCLEGRSLHLIVVIVKT